MATLSVQQFISHLPREQAVCKLGTKESMLEHLRQLYRTDEFSRRALDQAARARAQGERVRVETADRWERTAAGAVMAAVLRLSARLPKPEKTLRVYRDEARCDPEIKPRLKRWWAGYNGVRFRATLEDIVPAKAMEAAERLTAMPLAYTQGRLEARGCGPEIEVGERLERAEGRSGFTISAGHFEREPRAFEGVAVLEVEGVEIARVGCWAELEFKPRVERDDRIRGGTARLVKAPKNHRSLRLGEERVIELRCGPNGTWERLFGLGVKGGMVWVRGTADVEVLRIVARRAMLA